MAKILVVDDRQMVRDVIALVLQQWGYTVDLAKNGQDALNRFAADSADLVVLDMFMPVMNGFDALVVFRRRYPDTKVLAMSGGGGIRHGRRPGTGQEAGSPHRPGQTVHPRGNARDRLWLVGGLKSSPSSEPTAAD